MNEVIFQPETTEDNKSFLNIMLGQPDGGAFHIGFLHKNEEDVWTVSRLDCDEEKITSKVLDAISDRLDELNQVKRATYQVISNTSLTKLENLVNFWKRKGWRVTQPLLISTEHHIQTFYQVMERDLPDRD